jgi:hypothetical protein
MKFNCDQFENREPWAAEHTDVLDLFMSWTEEVITYGKKSRVSFS